MTQQKTDDPLVQQIIDGKFRLLRLLGQGGMGVVYEAEQIDFQRRVAVKLLKQVAVNTPSQLERFRQEAQTMSRLSHKNIVQLYAFGIFNGLPYMALEYVEGATLGCVLEEKRYLSLEETYAAFQQVLAAVGYAHSQGFIHRDLKPDNIILCKNAEGTIAKILDLGLAKLADGSQHLTKTGAVVGTPQYMSPEQCLSKPIAPQSDIYSLGCVIYECLAGHAPFQGDSLMALIYAHCNEPAPALVATNGDRLPDSVQQLVLGALEKEPERRYSSCEEFSSLFERVVAAPNSLPPELAKRKQANARVKSKPIGPVTKNHTVFACIIALAVLLPVVGFTVLKDFSRETESKSSSLADCCSAMEHSLAARDYTGANRFLLQAKSLATVKDAEYLKAQALQALLKASVNYGHSASLPNKEKLDMLDLLTTALSVLPEKTTDSHVQDALNEARWFAVGAPPNRDLTPLVATTVAAYKAGTFEDSGLAIDIIYSFVQDQEGQIRDASKEQSVAASKIAARAESTCKEMIGLLGSDSSNDARAYLGAFELTLARFLMQRQEFDTATLYLEAAIKHLDLPLRLRNNMPLEAERVCAQATLAQNLFAKNEHGSQTGKPWSLSELKRSDELFDQVLAELSQNPKLDLNLLYLPQIRFYSGRDKFTFARLLNDARCYQGAIARFVSAMAEVDKNCSIFDSYQEHLFLADAFIRTGQAPKARSIVQKVRAQLPQLKLLLTPEQYQTNLHWVEELETRAN